jgi:tryptophan synthase alpha chain
MSKISDAFKNGKALIAFIMACDPSLAATEKLVLDLEKSGADIIEIGVPFSDSIADGPTIIDAANRSIKKGTDLKKVLVLVRHVRNSSQTPVILMTSYNIIFSFGIGEFLSEAGKAGVNGLILPDLPIDEAEEFKSNANKIGIDTIFLLAPNSSEGHIRRTAKLSTGFIYLMSLTGTTGERKELSGSISSMVRKIRKYTDKPVAIGFGISNPDQAKKAAEYADGVIVGSAIVKLNHEDPDKVSGFVKRLKKAINSIKS